MKKRFVAPMLRAEKTLETLTKGCTVAGSFQGDSGLSCDFD